MLYFVFCTKLLQWMFLDKNLSCSENILMIFCGLSSFLLKPHRQFPNDTTWHMTTGHGLDWLSMKHHKNPSNQACLHHMSMI